MSPTTRTLQSLLHYVPPMSLFFHLFQELDKPFISSVPLVCSSLYLGWLLLLYSFSFNWKSVRKDCFFPLLFCFMYIWHEQAPAIEPRSPASQMRILPQSYTCPDQLLFFYVWHLLGFCWMITEFKGHSFFK